MEISGALKAAKHIIDSHLETGHGSTSQSVFIALNAMPQSFQSEIAKKISNAISELEREAILKHKEL